MASRVGTSRFLPRRPRAALKWAIALLALMSAGVAGAGGAATSEAPRPAFSVADTVPLRFGVTDDYGKLHPCDPRFLSALRDIGYTMHRMTVAWDETRPTFILDKQLL